MTKKSIALILAFIVVFTFSAIALAQTTAPKTATEPQQKAAPPKTHTMKGAVVSVDAIANTLVVKGKKAEETFQMDLTAKIVINNQEVKLADLKKDTKVVVTYKVEGDKKVAIAIK